MTKLGRFVPYKLLFLEGNYTLDLDR